MNLSSRVFFSVTNHDQLSFRMQHFHGAMPTATQKREEFAVECNKDAVRLGASCAGCCTDTEQHQGSALETGKQEKEERITLILEHVGTESTAQGLLVKQFTQHLV